MPLLLVVDIVPFYQTKNVIKESWRLKDRKRIEYDSLQKYNDNKWFETPFCTKLFSFFNLHLITLDTYRGFYSFLYNVCISFCMLDIFFLIVWKLPKRVLSSACYVWKPLWIAFVSESAYTHIHIPGKGNTVYGKTNL